MNNNVRYLKKLKGVLDKIMGTTKLGYKYKGALDEAIELINADETILTTKYFTVNSYNNNEGIIVDVVHNETGGIVKTFELDSLQVIDESHIGES